MTNFQDAIEEYHKQNFQKSYSLFDKCLDASYHDSQLLQNGMILINLEKYEQAIIYLDKILSVSPDDSEILSRKGHCYKILGQTNQALKVFENVLSLNPSNLCALYNLAIIFINLEKYEQAIIYLDKILSVSPDDSNTLYFKALILEKLERFDQSVKHYLNSIKISPNDTFTLQSISEHLVHHLGKEYATPVFKRMLQDNSDDIMANHGMKILSGSVYDY